MSEQSKLHRQTNALSREQLLLYLASALQTHSLKFGRQAALAWLSSYPGDLEVSFFMAKFLLLEGKNKQASTILEDICRRDPEFMDAQESLAIANAGSDNKLFESAISCAYALGKSVKDVELVPAWGTKLRTAIKQFRTNQLQQAKGLIEEILSFQLDVPLPGVIHLYLVDRLEGKDEAYQLAKLYQKQWSDVLAVNYYVAQGLLKAGNDSASISLLHRSAANDPTAEIASRVWGDNNPYRNLWPVIRPISFDVPLPSEISALFGWNKIGLGGSKAGPATSDDRLYFEGKDLVEDEGKQSIPEYSNASASDMLAVDESKLETGSEIRTEDPDSVAFPDELKAVFADINDGDSFDKTEKVEELEDLMPAEATAKSVEKAFKKMANRLKQKNLMNSDGRFPTYVIFTTKSGLEMSYGPQNTEVIDKELKQLAEAVQSTKKWGGLVYYPDDAEGNEKLGLPVAKGTDPWELKIALADLDKYLAGKGAMIGALLIVGGDEIVPYHKLPNPTDDSDPEVLSDNPYATLDSNYFVPEWPVGRLPGEKGKDAGLLLTKIRQAIATHNPAKKKKSITDYVLPIISLFRQIIQLFSFRPAGKASSFGYTAAVWKKASADTYRAIGDEKALLACPPEYSGSFSGERINYAELGYFNLHGLLDGAEWFGQPDASGSITGVDYPVALKPKDLTKNGQSPEIVFTEACYGGHVSNKTEDTSLALKFLSNGTKAVAGSTCISYGSIQAPLIGADLLANLFWRYLLAGLTAGDAMLKAKLEFIKEMNKRQNFLDGEDQKTLISFVLYGDPLAYYSKAASAGKNLARQKSYEDFQTTMDDVDVLDDEQLDIDPDKIKKVKEQLDAYLPGINQSKMVISKQIYTTEAIQFDFDSKRKKKVSKSSGTGRTVVTISKQVKSYQNIHQHFARATLDKSGKVVKLAVSR